MKRNKCLICESKNLIKIIDLGVHPFADTFIKKDDLDKSELIYPLQCNLCTKCGHVQTRYITDPNDRYCLNDYSYTSSNSDFSRNHWKRFVIDILKYKIFDKDDFILEIGSNDGYLLKQFNESGYMNTLGIDPSSKMVEVAKKEYNVETINSLFPISKEQKENIIKEKGKAKLIIANNVFNHSDDPSKFVAMVEEMLDEEGIFVFEVPYWLDSVKSKKFDQIYHEHVSYFSVTSAEAVIQRNKMYCRGIEFIDYHGGSIRFFASRNPYERKYLNSVLLMEKEFGLFKEETYENLMNDILNSRNKFMKKVYQLKIDGYNVIAVGAAAKGNTFLNFCKLDNSLLDYVTDSSEHKQNKYTPLTRIPICGDEIFSKYKKVYAMILSWNISTKIKENLYKINPSIKFISFEE